MLYENAVLDRQAGWAGRSEGRVRVLLADHHPIYRVGTRRILAQAGCSIVAETGDAVETIALAASLTPDVVVCAADLPESSCFELARALRGAPAHPAVILLATVETDDLLFQATRAGIASLLSRQVAAETLLDSVRRASQGEFPIDEQVLGQPSVAERVLKVFGDLNRANGPTGGSGAPLSERELQVLACMARGKSNKEIGRMLAISDQTVKNHISSVLRKLAVNDRTQAVVLAVQRGWIDLSASHAPAVEATGPRVSRQTGRRPTARHAAA